MRARFSSMAVCGSIAALILTTAARAARARTVTMAVAVLALGMVAGVAHAQTQRPNIPTTRRRAVTTAPVRTLRDVRPTRLDRGDVLVLECPGIGADERADVRLRARVNDADATAAAVDWALEGRTASGDRVLVDFDGALAAHVSGPTRLSSVTFDITTSGGGRCASGPEPIDLAFYQGSVRRLVNRAGDPLATLPTGLLGIVIMIAVALALHLLVAPLTGLVTVWERKIAGRMQSRLGPNRTGPRGWLQWLADALKLITKEDLIPTHADARLYRLAPYLIWMSVFATFVVLPLSQSAIVADLNMGLVYLAAVTSFVVIALIIAGWASNSKWTLLGGMRSAAQIVSYELPASLALLQVALLAGSLSPQDIVRAQGGLPQQWFVFANPFAFVSFWIFFIAALAEGNRTPFDLPEAESELVSGYNTEYSGFRFSVFFLAEWTNLYVVGAVVATMFLGGWNVPFVSPERVAASTALGVLSIAIALGKVIALVFVIIWIRWTLPRFRVDHMMAFCWKLLVPVSFVTFLGTAAWLLILRRLPALDAVARWGTFLVGGVALFAFFVSRVVVSLRATKLLHVGGRQFTLPFLERPVDRSLP